LRAGCGQARRSTSGGLTSTWNRLYTQSSDTYTSGAENPRLQNGT
jgi:hypothetical protein